MTELRTGQPGAGFFAVQQPQTSRDTSLSRSESTGGFMQSLKQTGAAVADMGQTADKTVTGTAISDGKAVNAAVKAENVTDKAVERETVTAAADIRETSSAAGTVKVDENAVKELNDLKEAVGKTETSGAAGEAQDAAEVGSNGGQLDEKDAGAALSEAETVTTGKSHLEQAREALENAMLKAFQELNDPEKEQEEFEEKLLLFLMKLVDSINGKSEKKSPFDTEEDEDDKKLGGALMEIIDNMMENAEKNAELNGNQTAGADTAFVGNYFLNMVSMNEAEAEEQADIGNGTVRPVELKERELFPELENLRGRGERVGLNPVVPRMYTQSAGNVRNSGESFSADNANEIAAAVSGSDTIADISRVSTVHIEETLSTAAVTAMPNTERITAETENTVRTEVSTDLPVTEQVVTAEGNNPVSAFGQYGETAGDSQNTDTSAAETMPRENEGKVDSDNPVNGFETAAEKAAADSISEAVRANVPETAEIGGIGEAKAPAEVNEGSVNLVSEVPNEASDKLYEQIALEVYTNVKHAMKAVYTEKGEEVTVTLVKEEEPERTEHIEDESEFEELARLFGLKKEATLPIFWREEDSEEETSGNMRYGTDPEKDNDTEAKGSIFGADISITSAKKIDAPIPRSIPSGSGIDRVVTQVVNRILSNLPEKGQETTLTVTLNPETLGRISLKLVENAGKISVTITAENKETAAILASRAENVQESMRDQGTQLEKYQVVYGAEQDGRADQQNYEGSSKNPYVRDTEEENDDGGEFEKILQGEL